MPRGAAAGFCQLLHSPKTQDGQSDKTSLHRPGHLWKLRFLTETGKVSEGIDIDLPVGFKGNESLSLARSRRTTVLCIKWCTGHERKCNPAKDCTPSLFSTTLNSSSHVLLAGSSSKLLPPPSGGQRAQERDRGQELPTLHTHPLNYVNLRLMREEADNCF